MGMAKESSRELQPGDRVSVLLTEKHELQGEDLMPHSAKFLRRHATGDWVDVELDREHAGGTTVLSVPAARVTLE